MENKARRYTIKICGNLFLEDSLLIARYLPDLMGWIFSPSSPRCISDTQARRLILEISSKHPTIKHVAVFANNSIPEIMRIVGNIPGLNYIQLSDGMGFIENVCFRLKKYKRLEIIPAIRMKNRVCDDDLFAMGKFPYFIIDSYVSGLPGGTGKRVARELLSGIKQPYLLAGGLRAENVAEALAGTYASGVDVSSGLEISPGRKDPKKVNDFFSTVRSVTLPLDDSLTY